MEKAKRGRRICAPFLNTFVYDGIRNIRTYTNYTDNDNVNDNDIDNDTDNVNENVDINNNCSNFENLSDDDSCENIAEKAIEFYFTAYSIYHNTNHPYLKAEQLNQAKKELGYHISEFCLSLEDVQDMIIHFFEHPPSKSDGNINLFVNRSVFVRVGYSTGVIWGYTEL